MINDINYGQWRWEKRNNKTLLPSGGINADGPYGRYRRPREIKIFHNDDYDDDNYINNNLQPRRPPKTTTMEKKSLMTMIQKPRFDDFWSTDSDIEWDSRSNRSSSWSSSSSWSYSTPSYTTYSHDDLYWKNRMDQQQQQQSTSMNDLYDKNSLSMKNNNNFSNLNESFSMPNLTVY